MVRHTLYTTCLLLICIFLGNSVVFAQLRFTDVSVAVGLNQTVAEYRPRNNKYWGSTLADFDRDGHIDFLLPNHVQNCDMYFMDPSQMRYSWRNLQVMRRDVHSTAAADMNGDGLLDIVMTRGGRNGNLVEGVPFVFETLKNQTLIKSQGRHLGLGTVPFRGRSVGFFDIDGDGDLDILFVNKRNQTATAAHMVYINDNGNYSLISGTGMENVEALWFQFVDANNDSYMDILFMKFRSVELWLGTGGYQFVNGTHLIPGAESMKHTRAVAEIDYDNDGDMDLLIVTGHIRGSRGDILLENLGEGLGYMKVTEPIGISEQGRNFHVTTGDFNNDGYMDFYLSRMTHFREPRRNDLMYINQGNKTFAMAPPHGTESKNPLSDGDNAIAFDYNLDGKIDLLVGTRNGTWNLFKNESTNGNNFMLVRVGVPRAGADWPLLRRSALGARVRIICNGRMFTQRVGSPGGSHSQSFLDTLHFGIGDCTRIDELIVRYVGGVVTRRRNIENVNRLMHVGLYYNCEPGKTGADCSRTIKKCSLTPCSDEDSKLCESTALVMKDCERNLNWCGSSTGTCNPMCLKVYCSL